MITMSFVMALAGVPPAVGAAAEDGGQNDKASTSGGDLSLLNSNIQHIRN
jgi:hypothetical protein